MGAGVGGLVVVSAAKFFFKQKQRFDIGAAYLALINFGLLVIAAGDKIAGFLHVKYGEFVLAFVPIGFFSVWLFGYFMDKKVGFFNQNEEVYAKKSFCWSKTHNDLDEIKRELRELRERG